MEHWYPDWLSEEYYSTWDELPSHMHEGVDRYVRRGTPPGDFLRAVVENDFKNAALRADQHNRARLYWWALFMVGCMPSDSQGSRAAVEAWIKSGGLGES